MATKNSGSISLIWYGRWRTVFASGMPAKWEKQLRRWMQQQRWFLDKNSVNEPIGLQFSQLIEVDGVLAWWLLVRVGQRCYQVALVLLPNWPGESVLRLSGHEAGLVVDAWQWPPFAQWAWQQMRPGMPIPTVIIEKGASNSQARFGEFSVLKVQRVITEGIHIEVEMGEELRKRGATMTVPLLCQLHWHERTVGLLFAYLPQAEDGWKWFLRDVGSTSKDVLQAVELLGQRTRELHRLLARPCALPAFSPYLLTADEWQARQALVASRLERVRQLLKLHHSRDRRTALLQQQFLRSNTNLPKLGPMHDLLVHRIHGDYHLGQVLRSDRDWKIIDFEGEPLRPMHERRAKDLPLRDVAGMLRSLAYGLATLGVTDTQQHAALRAAFLKGYAGEDAIDMQLLCLLELEKALYEVEYELRSRPDWLWIPLQALCEQGTIAS